MTEIERKELASKLFDRLQKTMINLYERWICEREYEDITDYAKPITAIVEEIGGKIVRMTKRPFGVIYQLSDATYHIRVTNTRYEYKRIK